MYDNLRSENSGAIGARNIAECMNNLDFQECGDTGLQRTSLDVEIEGFNEYANELNARSIILEVGGDETIAGATGDPIMENNPLSELFPTLSRSYSFEYSWTGNYNFDSHSHHQEKNSNCK